MAELSAELVAASTNVRVGWRVHWWLQRWGVRFVPNQLLARPLYAAGDDRPGVPDHLTGISFNTHGCQDQSIT